MLLAFSIMWKIIIVGLIWAQLYHQSSACFLAAKVNLDDVGAENPNMAPTVIQEKISGFVAESRLNTIEMEKKMQKYWDGYKKSGENVVSWVGRMISDREYFPYV